jgi:hypothetical protein
MVKEELKVVVICADNEGASLEIRVSMEDNLDNLRS